MLPGGQAAMLSGSIDEGLAETGVAQPVAEPTAVAVMPLGRPGVTSRYGVRVDPIHGRRRMHHGIDIAGTAGSAILASERGTIAFAGRAGGYGNMVEIDHGDGLRTRYAHLSRIGVRAGDRVERSQPIGAMGTTGRSTGVHLHFETRQHGRTVDPLLLLGAGEGRVAGQGRRVAAPAVHRSSFARRRAGAPEEGAVPLPGGEGGAAAGTAAQ